MYEADTVITKAISMHAHGSLCPAEMWNVIIQSLDGNEVEASINGLLESTRKLLAAQTFDSNYLNMQPIETRKVVFAWCERNRIR